MSIESTVRDILSQKQNGTIYTISPMATVFDALGVMASNNIGALLVVKEGTLVGIITERDYSRKIVLSNRSSRTTRVEEVMQPHPLHVLPNESARDCMVLMTEKKIRHLPVFDGSQLVGIVSMGDIMKAVIGDHEFLIDQLTRYVTDSFVSHEAPKW